MLVLGCILYITILFCVWAICRGGAIGEQKYIEELRKHHDS